jgi:hypothetical protein
MAWQPLTLAGVAAFAHAPWRRLWLVQSIFAVICAASFLWFALLNCVPVIEQAINQLPDQGRLEHGVLKWQGDSPARLAETPFLALVVDLDHTGQFSQAADVLVELGRDDFRISSVFGRYRQRYGSWLSLDIGQDALQPRWLAWMPVFCMGLLAGCALVLLLAWPWLAVLYSPVVVCLAFLMNRDCGWSGARKLAGAALLPGTLFLSFALGLYAFRQIELVGFLVTFGLHLVLSWIYILLAPTLLPASQKSRSKKENPFGSREDPEAPSTAKTENPFSKR